MRRFNCEGDYSFMTQDDAGDWVAFEAHEAEIKTLTAAMQKQAAYIAQLEKIVNNMDATINEIDDIARVI